MSEDGISEAEIRDAHETDLAAIQRIYAHHVLHGLGSFEETPPDFAEMRRRYGEVRTRNLPYLVAEAQGRVLGYAYAGPYRARSAYRFTVEDSIYIDPEAVGRGIGRRLLGALIDGCTELGYRQMVAIIGDSGNHASIALHAALGFAHVGKLHAVGFKAGRWVDSVFMQRPLGNGETTLPD